MVLLIALMIAAPAVAESSFKDTHRGLYCDKAAAIRADTIRRGWTYERDRDGPGNAVRVYYTRGSKILIVDYSADFSTGCIIGKQTMSQ